MLSVVTILLLLLEMELVTWVQILDTAACISLRVNALQTGMNQSVFPPAMGKWLDKLYSSTSLGEEKFWIPTSLTLSYILPVEEGFGWYILRYDIYILRENKIVPNVLDCNIGVSEF